MHLIYITTDTAPLRYAKAFLQSNGNAITTAPSDKVTHLLLNVPTFAPDGSLAGGRDLATLLQQLPPSITVIGGNLTAPVFQNYITIDLLQNESYLAENAAITAECALQVALDHLPATLGNSPVLILGWGRIAKCLAKLLASVGAQVTVAARKDRDLAMIKALGFNAAPTPQLSDHLPQYRIIFNTVPAMVLPDALIRHCRSDCLKIDLASVPGIESDDVITARGLPGKLAPEASGQLIAKAVSKLLDSKEAAL